MKILSISNVCLVVGLMVGLTVAWNNATPQLITGERLEVGGCPPCYTTRNTDCGDAPREDCTDTYLKCNTTGELECFDGLGPHSCTVDASCLNKKNENCN